MEEEWDLSVSAVVGCAGEVCGMRQVGERGEKDGSKYWGAEKVCSS